MNPPPPHIHTFFFSVLLDLFGNNFILGDFGVVSRGCVSHLLWELDTAGFLDRNNLLFLRQLWRSCFLWQSEVDHVLRNHSNSVVCYVGLNTLCGPSAPWLLQWSRLFTPRSVWKRPVSVDQEAQEAKARCWECGLAGEVLALHAQIPGLILSTAQAR